MAIRQIKALGKNYDISYEIKNQKATKTILIIHGWGSKKEIMSKAFGSFLKNFKHIYIDLPGMGLSNIHTPLNTEKYAIIVKAFLSSLNISPDIVMGHSFGGKISTLLEPKNLVLLSTAGIVEPKPFMVRFKIRLFKLLKFFGFGAFYRLFATKDVSGMSRVMYETLKNVVDEDFRDKFANTKSKTLIFWGESDQAVSVKSGELINRLIKNSEFYPLSGDHFFFLSHAKFIAQKIEESLLNDDITLPKESLVFDPLDEISGVGDVIEREYSKGDETISKEQKLDDKLKKDIEKAIELFDDNLENKDNLDDKISTAHDALDINLKANSDENLTKDDLSDENLGSEISDKIETNIQDDSSSGENLVSDKSSFKSENLDSQIYIAKSLFDDLDSFSDVGDVFEREYKPKIEPKKPEPKPVDNRKFRYQNVGNGVYEKIYEDMDGFSEQKIVNSDEYTEIYENFVTKDSKNLFNESSDKNSDESFLEDDIKVDNSFDTIDESAKSSSMDSDDFEAKDKTYSDSLEKKPNKDDDLEFKSRFIASSSDEKKDNDVLTFSEIFKKRFMGDDK